MLCYHQLSERHKLRLRSKGTRAGSRTPVRCRVSAHGTPAPPTELNSALYLYFLLVKIVFYFSKICSGEINVLNATTFLAESHLGCIHLAFRGRELWQAMSESFFPSQVQPESRSCQEEWYFLWLFLHFSSSASVR